ncbi:MAG: hypothetical protein FWB90_00750 [Fibromonadales bacterium]|nr:hypothetical protein [Fibromonadales bacterium]
MSLEKSTFSQRCKIVAVSPIAGNLIRNEVDRLRAQGLSASDKSVTSAAIVKVYGETQAPQTHGAGGADV